MAPPQLTLLESLHQEREILVAAIRERAPQDRPIQILEAGCGRRWPLDLGDLETVLTGVDLDEAALAVRRANRGDLDEVVVGDLRRVQLPRDHYDVIFSAFVLEHVRGAESVLVAMARWVRPGGIIILKVPDRDTVAGLVTRLTPFWFHVAYKRCVLRKPNAGKPGYGPYPTVFDEVVSRSGVRRFCAEQGLCVRAEYGSAWLMNKLGRLAPPVRLVSRVIAMASRERLAHGHINLTYVIERPPAVAGR